MRIGIFSSDSTIDSIVAAAREAEEQGFATYWMSQIFGLDALTTLAIVGREVPRIELGTAVVPTYPRHPMTIAAQALTVQAASGGRLVLGIGLSHKMVIENMFGYSFEKPVRHMREYLSALAPLIRDGAVQYTGETLTANLSVDIAGSSPCPILLAALGTQMLELAGQVADGTCTWMTGPATLAEHTTPTITKAAAEAGRPAPRISASLPVRVTTDVDAAREQASRVFQIYGMLPSYRAMLDREGAEGPADVAIIGDEATVRTAIQRVAESGATDFVAVEFGGSAVERAETRELLRSLI